jgi:hypothetical protein
MARVKRPKGHGSRSVVELDLSQFVTLLDPARHGIEGPKFDPESYYITSGDATKKAEAMIRDLKAYGTNFAGPFLVDIEATVQGAQRLLAHLIEVRGSFIFLELDRRAGSLVLLPKNPRLTPSNYPKCKEARQCP